ncbi:MAG: hypothetical protein NTX75_01810 [Proteobacteria bacterium]|nr:hypothetical protein [Pseudomonadota bacterium]
MSIRAYRVNEIKLGGETFNLWHDEKVAQYLNDNGYFDSLNADMCGVMEISVTSLKAMLKIADNDQVRSNIKIDIAFAKKNKRNYLQYDCF